VLALNVTVVPGCRPLHGAQESPVLLLRRKVDGQAVMIIERDAGADVLRSSPTRKDDAFSRERESLRRCYSHSSCLSQPSRPRRGVL